MRSQRLSVTVAAIAAICGAALSVAPTPAASQEPTAVGLWERLDEKTKKPVIWFLFVDRGGIFEGYAAKLFPEPGKTPDPNCTRCTDDRKGAPMLGLPMIRGMKRVGLKYEGGTVLDPRNGDIWRAMMTLLPEKGVLRLRGFLLIPSIGLDEDWHRLPDSAYQQIDPAILTKYAPERLEAKKGKAKK
jgi:hypothetical protein